MNQAHPEDSEPTDEGAITRPRLEIAVALVVCVLVMLGPLIYIQGEYEAFVSEKGAPLEGAAGAGLALAVVFRTVSRTVLRTVIRTSARAGMRASLKGLFRSAVRTGMRSSTANIVKTASQKLPSRTPPPTIRAANIQSLLFASVLLYVSWVIVIGVGQPYTNLLDKDASIAQAEAVALEEEQVLAALYEQARAAYDAEQAYLQLQEQYRDLRVALKGARDSETQQQLEDEITRINLDLTLAERELAEALKASGNRKVAPDEDSLPEVIPRFPWMKKLQDELFTYAPYPGKTAWSSPVIWLGGLAMVLPMWFIFFVQLLWVRRQGLVIRHETGIDGGLIQLYFAGAFSFMPLTSDTIVVGADDVQRGRTAIVGLISPVIVGLALWVLWRVTGQTAILFLADAFIMYPMIQIFPLSPLEGLYAWRYSRVVWTILFIAIMALFLFVGSEALRNVI
ncbi:MAG: hypothetical protein AAFV53_05080 [Myxococcota bacterium]